MDEVLQIKTLQFLQLATLDPCEGFCICANVWFRLDFPCEFCVDRISRIRYTVIEAVL